MLSWTRSILASLFRRQKLVIALRKDSPFYQAMVSMISTELFFYPEGGHHGVIDKLPLDLWVTCDSDLVEKKALRLMKKKALTVDSARELLLTGLPTSLKNIFLLPCDEQSPPAVECYSPHFSAREIKADGLSSDYFYSLEDDKHTLSEGMRENAVKGIIILCLHAYLAGFLAEGREDAAKALYFPGDPELDLSMSRRLAFGVIRELIVLKHFVNLPDFWTTATRLQAAGWNLVSFSDWSDTMNRVRVEGLLHADEKARAMYEVMVAILKQPHNLPSLVNECQTYILEDEPEGPSSFHRSIENNPNVASLHNSKESLLR